MHKIVISAKTSLRYTAAQDETFRLGSAEPAGDTIYRFSAVDGWVTREEPAPEDLVTLDRGLVTLDSLEAKQSTQAPRASRPWLPGRGTPGEVLPPTGTPEPERRSVRRGDGGDPAGAARGAASDARIGAGAALGPPEGLGRVGVPCRGTCRLARSSSCMSVSVGHCSTLWRVHNGQSSR